MTESTTLRGNIVVHHLENSRSQRILWLLEELELPYEIKSYKRTAEKRAPKELLDIHPLGKSPVLTDGPNLTLAESGAIIEYLINRYGKDKVGIEESSAAWVDNLYWTHCSEGSIQPLLVRRFTYQFAPTVMPAIIRPLARLLFNKLDEKAIAPDLERHGKLIEERLKEVETKGGWIAGTGEDRPTSADFIMSFTLETFLLRAPEYLGERTREYVKKLQARPAYQKGIQRGGDYAYLLK